MRVKTIVIRDFKRFADLTVEGLPDTARLVVLAGPNGFGKSSLFDALFTFRGSFSSAGIHWEPSYHSRSSSAFNHSIVNVSFHDVVAPEPQNRRHYFYFRTAYRNDPTLAVSSIARQGAAVEENRFQKMIDNDTSVNKNYQRLVGDLVEDVAGREPDAVTFGDYRAKVLGSIREPMQRLFPGLRLTDFGNPLSDGTFFFDKGAISHFKYTNLSGGEKSAFDLILDIVTKSREFNDTIYCIDEPETHMNSSIHGALLEVLLGLLPTKCQLWISTHSIGMMRRALDIEQSAPGSVVFLDFGNANFDDRVVMRPTKPTRNFWLDSLRVALDDIAELVAPKEIVICEGSGTGRNADHDASCYNTIFEDEFPEVQFVSGGNAFDVASDRLSFVRLLPRVVSGISVKRLIDRDDRSAGEINDLTAEGVLVLPERNLQSYLWADDVLEALCHAEGKPEVISEVLAIKSKALKDSVEESASAPNDWKSAAGRIFTGLKQRLQLTGRGNDARGFERETLAPLIRPGMDTYTKLKAAVFPSSASAA